MQREHLRFIVTNDPEHDFDLMQEAYKGDEQIADVRPINGTWEVTFFSGKPFCKISWEDFTRIHKVFSQFVAEMTVVSEAEQRETRL